MRTRKLQIPITIGEGRAERMLADLVRFGNWCVDPIQPMAAVRPLIKQSGIDYRRLISKTRRFFEYVPKFENLIGSTFEAVGKVAVARQLPDGTFLQVVDPTDEDGGKIVLHNYLAKFEFACSQLLKVVQSESLEELLSAITKGIASIDSFLVEVATDLNYNHPAMPPFDLADHRLNTEDRIESGYPLSRGLALRSLDETGKTISRCGSEGTRGTSTTKTHVAQSHWRNWRNLATFSVRALRAYFLTFTLSLSGGFPARS
jgi:hypothetical protein